MRKIKTIKGIIRKRKNTSLVALLADKKCNTARLGNTLINMENFGSITLFVSESDVMIQNNAKVS